MYGDRKSKYRCPSGDDARDLEITKNGEWISRIVKISPRIDSKENVKVTLYYD
jgi:hypothetical protein